jgi:hypothetical protein
MNKEPNTELAELSEADRAEFERLERINTDLQNATEAAFNDLPLAERLSQYRHKLPDREWVEVMHHAAFHALGGPLAFAEWANQNKDIFYPQWMKALQATGGLAKAGQGTQIVIQTNVPAGPLDHGIYTIDVPGGAPLEGDDDE